MVADDVIRPGEAIQLNRAGFGYGGGPVVYHRSGFVLGHQLNFAARPANGVSRGFSDQPDRSQPVPAAFHASGFVRQLNVAPPSPSPCSPRTTASTGPTPQSAPSWRPWC